jgi:type I restriction enzyme M protein
MSDAELKQYFLQHCEDKAALQAYPAISTEDLLNIPIALPKESIRRQITEKVRESGKAPEQSKQLLDIAKTGVEQAIKTNEATAIA